VSRSRNHSCGRACGLCAYTAARNKRDAAAVANDNRDAESHAEPEDDHSYCDGCMCSYCDPDYADSPRYAGDRSVLRAPLWRHVQ
jgi:hypothetical protein